MPPAAAASGWAPVARPPLEPGIASQVVPCIPSHPIPSHPAARSTDALSQALSYSPASPSASISFPSFIFLISSHIRSSRDLSLSLTFPPFYLDLIRPLPDSCFIVLVQLHCCSACDRRSCLSFSLSSSSPPVPSSVIPTKLTRPTVPSARSNHQDESSVPIAKPPTDLAETKLTSWKRFLCTRSVSASASAGSHPSQQRPLWSVLVSVIIIDTQ